MTRTCGILSTLGLSIGVIGATWAAAAQPAAAPPAAAPPAAPAVPAAAPVPATRPAARPATSPTTSPFDAYDPEIRAIGQLNWKGADFKALDVQSRGAALVALNKLLDVAGSKADARADLLVEYLDKHELGPAYTADTSADDLKPAITFEDAEKIAAAFILSPRGQQKFGDEFTQSSPEAQQKYLDLYQKTCRRKFEDVAEARGQVRTMAKFLQKQGKLEEFLAWSKAERERRQKEHDAELARKAEDRAKDEAARRAEAVAAAERRKAAEEQAKQELALRQLDYAYQQAQAPNEGQWSGNPGTGYGDYNDWGYVWTPGAYYYAPQYRDAARDRINTTWGRWNGARGGGGRPAPRAWSRRR